MFYAADFGQAHFTKRQKLWKFNPVLLWTQKQVDDFFRERQIPQNEVYTKLKLPRNGCMPCTGFLHWEEQMARLNPRMYAYVQKLRGQQLMDDWFGNEEITDTCNVDSEALEQIG